MAQQQITGDTGTVDGSGNFTTYTVPATSLITPTCVSVTTDGSGASGSYLPCLTFRTITGAIIARCPAPEVAAGDTAEVSWFPGIGTGGSTPTPSGAGLAVASMFNAPGSGTSIAADDLEHFVSIADGVSGAGFATTDASVFTNGSSSLFTGSPVFGIQIHAVGTYAIFNNSFALGGGTSGHSVTGYWAGSDGSSPSFFQQGRTAGNATDTWDEGQAGVGPHNFVHEWITVDVGQTPATLAVFGQVNGGTAVTMSFQMMVVQWTTNVLSKL